VEFSKQKEKRMKKQSTFPVFWRLAGLLLIASLVLAACAQATVTPTATAVPPTPVPTDTPAPTPEPAVTKVIQDFEAGAVPYDGQNATASIGDVAYNGVASLKS
jgi:ABC-type glycerol-3-phosphate transport system substrate-binding protein